MPSSTRSSLITMPTWTPDAAARTSRDRTSVTLPATHTPGTDRPVVPLLVRLRTVPRRPALAGAGAVRRHHAVRHPRGGTGRVLPDHVAHRRCGRVARPHRGTHHIGPSSRRPPAARAR